VTGVPVRVSMVAGTQYALRLAMPPRHVESPLPAIDAAVEKALVPVLPKNTCRCDLPGSRGNTSGSSNAMCE